MPKNRRGNRAWTAVARATALAAVVLAPAAALAATAQSGGSSFPPFDSRTFGSQLFWLALTFGAVYLLMRNVALPRIASVLETREATIAKALQDAADAQAEAEKASAAQEAALAKARAEAEAIGRAAKEAGAKENDARRATVEADLNARMVAAERDITAAKAAAMQNVETIATEAATAIVEQLSGKAPAEADVRAALAASKS